MKTKSDVFEKFISLGISLSLLKEAHLSESDFENVYRKVKLLKEALNISHSWQLALLTGRKEYFFEHLDKQDDTNQNVAFYAICSESESVLQWIYEEHPYLIDQYKSMHWLMNPGVDTFIKDYSIFASVLKSSSLLNWILHSKYFPLFSQEQAKFLLVVIGSFNWEALDKLKQDNPNFITSYGSILIHLAIINKKVALFQWVVQNMPNQLMTPEFFDEAVTFGMLDAVNWFLKCAPPEIRDYRSPNGTTILHLAGLSKSNRVFDAITGFKKDSLWETDNKGRYLTEYALNSFKPNRVDKSITFINSTALKLEHVPKRFADKEPDQEWIRGKGEIKDCLAFTTNQVLDINFNLQTIDCGIHKLLEESAHKLQRNITIAAFEKVKPLVLFLLFMRSELDLPLDIIVEISLIILPKEVPQETITTYRKHFFFKNNEVANANCSTFEDEEDSQEEIHFVDTELLLYLDGQK